MTALIVDTRESVSIRLVYGRPVTLDREVLGDLVPYDVPWITGAGEPAELWISRPIMIGTARVSPGTYALWTLPTRHGVTLIVNRDRSNRYDAASDVARVPVLADSLPSPVAQLTIAIRNDRGGPDTLVTQYDRGQSDARHLDHYTIGVHPGARQVLVISWGRFRWSVPVTLP
jgi:hypothetical protein